MRTCGRCGAVYKSLAGLAQKQQLSPAEIANHVVAWPNNVAIDVRACARCDAPIACLAPLISG
jgi:hypothetical protein